MSLGHGAKIATRDLLINVDPTSKISKNTDNLNYWWARIAAGHPTTQSGLEDLLDSTSSYSFTSGMHSGNVSFGDGSQQVRDGTNTNVGTVDARPSYLTRASYYSWMAKGWIWIPETGDYEFAIDGDDACHLKIGGHGFAFQGTRPSSAVATTTLSKGWHLFEIQMEENGGGDGIAITWKIPGGSWEIIPANYFRPLFSNVGTSSSEIYEAKHYDTFRTGTNNYLSFNGSTTYLELDAPGFTAGNIWTIEVVLRTNDSSVQQRYLTPNANGIDNFLYIQSGQAKMLYCQASDTNNTSIGGGTINNNQWHHIVATMNDTTAELWLDGSSLQSKTESFSIASWNATWRIGQRGNSTHYFNGDIGLIRAYNRVLSDAEITRNYTAIRGRFGI